MEICWALVINYLNCLNLLNLWNYSISLSISRGLGEGINQSYLESKIMLVVYLQKYLEQNPLDVEESLFQALGCTLISFTVVNKENSSSNFVLSLFHVSCLMNIFD